MTIARRYLYETADAVRLEALADGVVDRRSPISWASSGARSGTTGCISGHGWSGSRSDDGEPRDRLVAALDDARAARRDGLHAARGGGYARRGAASSPDRWRISRATGAPRIADASGPRIAARRRRPWIRGSADSATATPFRWLWSEFTTVRRSIRERPGERRDMVDRHRGPSESASPRRPRDRAATRRSRSLSVVDLGIVHRVDGRAGGIDVAILPTFVGCPALDVIRATIGERLGRDSAGCPGRRRHSRCHGHRTGSRERSPRAPGGRYRPAR